MNNSSLFAADRTTHLKIVVVSLLCAMLVAGIGLAARITDDAAGASGRWEATVIKPATPLTASAGEDRSVR
jgi:ABC-type proline/glycine betaine transport system permease subunit